jgi:tetratricopeptide (TPR) repeat protein
MAETWTPEELDRWPEFAYLLADALRRVGRADDSLGFACRADSGAVRAADRRLELRSINLVGMLHYESGDLGEAQARFEQLLDRATELQDDEFAARASNNLGVLANIRGRRDLALTFYQRSLAAYYRLGHARGLAQTHYNVGISYRDLGFPEDAERHYATAIRYAEEAGSDDVTAHSEVERAYLRARTGDAELAEAMASRALSSLEAMEDPAGAANAVRILAIAAEIRGDLPLAFERLDRAAEIISRHPDLLLEAEIERDRGRLFLTRGQPHLATAAIERAADAYARLGAEEDERATRAILSSIVPQIDGLS